jgi:hypothetical protein
MLRTELRKNVRHPLFKLVKALARHAVNGRIVLSSNLYPWQGKTEAVWTSKSDTVVLTLLAKFKRSPSNGSAKQC